MFSMYSTPEFCSMERTVVDIHTAQINCLSTQTYEHTETLARLQNQVTMLGTRLQHTQIHIGAVDARVPSFKVVATVLQTLCEKMNEVVVRMRMKATERDACAFDDTFLLDLNGLAYDDWRGAKPSCCECARLQVCDECFNV